MASTISGFEYDVFISYRQNDNRSGWVKEFVHNLIEELASTLKDKVTIYFDENPYDGLLETDLVNDSLEDKLKCLIFIPILSQTYCDTKSFAWKNEFLVFKKMATEDSFGIKIKLPNGNTTSRILPIRIHDLDGDDIVLCEAEIGPLRSIDFIFRSPGVNRPLRLQEEHPHDNLNKTFYRDQINKVANCIKEMMATFKGTRTQSSPLPTTVESLPHPKRKRLAFFSAIALSLLVVGFVGYYLFQPLPEPLDGSIAVLPFSDMSPDHDQEYFSDGISEELINSLVKIEGLTVPGRTSSFQFKGKNVDLTDVAKKLNVSFILEGSVRKSGDHLRITAQLVDGGNGFHLWSETYDHNIKDIFKAQDEVTKGIVRQLRKRVGALGELKERKIHTTSLAAYDLYWKGHQQFLLKGEHVIKAQEYLKEAVRLDPNFAMGHAALAEAYAVYDLGLGNKQEALASAHRALALDSTISSAYAVIAWTEGTLAIANPPPDVYKWAEQARINYERAFKLDPQNSTAHLWLAITDMYFGLYEQSMARLKIAVEIDPLVPINYGALGMVESFYGDSIGLTHLEEGIRLGWKAGIQRLAFYYLDHQEWEKAESAFLQHSKNFPIGPPIDYHKLVEGIRTKDVQAVRNIMDSITHYKGLIAGFRSKVYYLAGDYERAIANLDDWGVQEAMRPSRKELRERDGFKKYVRQHNFLSYWNKYGWPGMCHAEGQNDFECD